MCIRDRSFDLGGETVLERSVRAFDECPEVDELVIVTGASSENAQRAAARCKKPVRLVKGGSTRAESARSGVAAAHGRLVAVHDAARPFVSQSVIADTIAAAARCEMCIRDSFQVGSIITTTGFSSCDFDLWPTLAKEVLVLLMFVGACAGSTGGGIKVSRFLLLGKTLGKELKQALHPQVVAPVRMDGKLVNHETIRTTNVFLAAYIFIFAASFMLVSLDGFDTVSYTHLSGRY